MNHLEDILGEGWDVYPAGGATGEAFFAENEEQKLFLKRNSSPFLAVLSAEGIVPKLMWTRRLENGDVITAQRWMNGRELKHSEMSGEPVARLLRKIHQSRPLLNMLKRLGKTPLRPEHTLTHIETAIEKDLISVPAVSQALAFMQRNLPYIETNETAVCHCDVNHNNWLVTETGRLYLIDWDGAMIADPAIDLGSLLYSYIPRDEWTGWLEKYGIVLDEGLELRMKWHALSQLLSFIQWHKGKNRLEEMDSLLRQLQYVLEV